ncbi:VOC family protein [Streptomyces phaeochromogenes]|uniref:VOC family protein n=1 Tax=Streptomyces phaeochromogenes TaxID=1923 RepID=UPI00368542DA
MHGSYQVTERKISPHQDRLRPSLARGWTESLVAHGGKRVKAGQGEQSWVVMADPESNEFCVLGQWQQ